MFSNGKWILWACGFIALAALSARLPALFNSGLPGTDDIMRLQQVRDLLAGQAWHDVDQSRLLTPEGGAMHWSRLPDLFLAGLIWLMTPLFGAHTAEMLAAGLWPLMLFAVAMAFLFTLMARLGVNRMGQLFGLLFLVGSPAFSNFWPGRIDHHGFVVVCVLAGFTALLSPRLSARSGILLALSLCAALSIAIEALPYVAGLIAIAGLFWVVRGHREAVRLTATGLGLVAFATAFLVFDAPGFGSQRMVCDAYGSSHWAALIVGGASLAFIGIFGGFWDHWLKRLGVGMIAAALTIAVFVWVNPACFDDPYAAVPDTVRDTWLSVVAEAQSLPQLLEQRLDQVFWVFGSLIVSSIAAALMIVQAKPKERLGRVGAAIMLGLAIALTIWQVRGQSFSHVFAVISAGWLVGVLMADWQEKRGAQALLVFALSVILLAPMTWRMLGETAFAPARGHQLSGALGLQCTDPKPIKALAELPEMKVHTPIDLGIPVLTYTQHSVFVGPYHRNILGIERASLVLIGDLDLAHDRLIEMQATHLVYCAGLPETDRYGAQWPDSLAAYLNQNQTPKWLIPEGKIDETEGTLRVYRIAPKPTG
jgi:hypothetical protein